MGAVLLILEGDRMGPGEKITFKAQEREVKETLFAFTMFSLFNQVEGARHLGRNTKNKTLSLHWNSRDSPQKP